MREISANDVLGKQSIIKWLPVYLAQKRADKEKVDREIEKSGRSTIHQDPQALVTFECIFIQTLLAGFQILCKCPLMEARSVFILSLRNFENSIKVYPRISIISSKNYFVIFYRLDFKLSKTIRHPLVCPQITHRSVTSRTLLDHLALAHSRHCYSLE